MNDTRRTALACLCILLLGIVNWLMSASAQGAADSGPSCEEVTSASLCDRVSRPIVSGSHTFWTNEAAAYQVLQSLSNEELRALLEVSTAAVLALIPDRVAKGIKNADVTARHQQARQILAGRARLHEFADYMAENFTSPSCEDYSVWAHSFELVIVTGASVAAPFGFPGVVVGVLLVRGGMLTQHFMC